MKSTAHLYAERFVTEGLMAGLSLDVIEAGSKDVSLASGGCTRWFRYHVAAFCTQKRHADQLAQERLLAHKDRLATLLEIDGFRLEKGRFGAKNRKAWRVWNPDGGHALVYLHGRELTPEQALAEAMQTKHWCY